jgi:hypothetical protein
MVVGWGVGCWEVDGCWLEGEAMEHGTEMGSWWLGGGGLWLEGVRDGAWLWDGELVAGRRRVGSERVEVWSMAVGWGVGGWEEEGW